jgi:hypothetical protein
MMSQNLIQKLATRANKRHTLLHLVAPWSFTNE